jgi:hypothetical protein
MPDGKSKFQIPSSKESSEFRPPKTVRPILGWSVNLNPKPPAVPQQIPVRLQRYEETVPPVGRRKYWLHPASGLLILAVDWLFFAPEAATFEVAAILTCPLAFAVTAAGVFWIQRRKNGDSFGSAAAKAFFGGIVAGIPTSIAGTIVGTLVLVLSGLSNWNHRRDSKSER